VWGSFKSMISDSEESRVKTMSHGICRLRPEYADITNALPHVIFTPFEVKDTEGRKRAFEQRGQLLAYFLQRSPNLTLFVFPSG
jgi:hypothetical protein